MEESIPFNKLSDNEFQLLNRHGITNIIGEQATINLLSPTQNVHLRSINELIHNCPQNDDDEDFIPTLNCKYFSIDDFQKIKIKESNSFSIFHLNIHSIQKHIEELRIMFSMLKIKFDASAISESKLQKNIEYRLYFYRWLSPTSRH